MAPRLTRSVGVHHHHRPDLGGSTVVPIFHSVPVLHAHAWTVLAPVKIISAALLGWCFVFFGFQFQKE
eukprot:GSA25T00014532001.1